MIRFASDSDRTALSDLWQSVFCEDIEVIDNFFDNIFHTAKTPVMCIEGEIVSALFLLPCSIKQYSGRYVYCAMTAPTHRGKGYMKKLLDFSFGCCEDFLILVPAEKKLFDYYKKCGFENYGICRTHTVNRLTPPKFKDSLKYDCKLNFDGVIDEYWKSSCIHYGGKAKTCGLVFNDDGIIIRNASGNYCDFPSELLIDGTVIKGDISFGNEEYPAMINTNNSTVKNLCCYVGITLE